MHKLMAFVASSLLLVSTTSRAQSEEWTCPTTDKVALLARSPGWVSGDTLTYSFQAPAFAFALMRYSEAVGPGASCHYKIENGGVLRIWKIGTCQAARGTWKASGPITECESSNPAECSLRCTPK